MTSSPAFHPSPWQPGGRTVLSSMSVLQDVTEENAEICLGVKANMGMVPPGTAPRALSEPCLHAHFAQGAAGPCTLLVCPAMGARPFCAVLIGLPAAQAAQLSAGRSNSLPYLPYAPYGPSMVNHAELRPVKESIDEGIEEVDLGSEEVEADESVRLCDLSA